MQASRYMRIKKGYRNLDLRFEVNARATAGYLAQGAGLPDWDIGFLADALVSRACVSDRVQEMDCITHVSQMNSMYRENVIAVIQVLSGLRFECAIVPLGNELGASEGLHVLHAQWIDRMPMPRLRTLIEECGLDSDEFRTAIRKECKARDLQRFTANLRAMHPVQGVSHGEQHLSVQQMAS